MKKIDLLLAATVLGAMASCSYDDGKLWDKVDEIEARLNEPGPKFGFSVRDAEGVQYVKNGTTRSYKLSCEGVNEIIVTKPDGWKAVIEDSTLYVTSPLFENEYAEESGVITLFALGKEETKSVSMEVKNFELRVLTFEDNDFKAAPYTLDSGKEIKSWSDLIDSPQYMGPLLYGDMMDAGYYWYDENHTGLMSEFPENWSSKVYLGGGQAISNYVEMDLSKGDYENQLAVYYKDPETGFGGHNGSKNFCVHYGYRDNSAYSTENLPFICFADGEAHIIDHMYVMNTTYAMACYLDVNGLTAQIGDEYWVKLVAIGYDEEGNKTAEVEFSMVDGPEKIVKEWTKWDLSSLGKVSRVEFNVTGSSDNGYGFSQPAYFAYDDVAVVF